jgi:hypothetical protein
MTLDFEGPDEYTEEEAKQVLNDVLDTIVKIVERAVNNELTSGSGSDSASASTSTSGGE